MVKQAQGTMSKVLQMMESNMYCPDIIQQTDSVIGLLRSAKCELLAGHLDTCVTKKLRENKNQAIRELIKIYNLSN